MILYTQQTKEKYEELKEKGVLRAPSNEESYKEQEFMFSLGYMWMAKQMKERIGEQKEFDFSYPIWAWSKNENLEEEIYTFDKESYLLECEVPDKEILLSDFDNFNNVLDGGYIPNVSAEEDEGEYDRQCDLYNQKMKKIGYSDTQTLLSDYFIKGNKSEEVQALVKELTKSWENIFDVSNSEYIQACVWEIKEEQVKSERFIPLRQHFF